MLILCCTACQCDVERFKNLRVIVISWISCLWFKKKMAKFCIFENESQIALNLSVLISFPNSLRWSLLINLVNSQIHINSYHSKWWNLSNLLRYQSFSTFHRCCPLWCSSLSAFTFSAGWTRSLCFGSVSSMWYRSSGFCSSSWRHTSAHLLFQLRPL